MNKLLTWLDNSLLKFGTIFALIFTALYPKLPSVHITNTWVYIRLEDFVIAAVTLLWVVQLLRKKVKLALPVGIPLIIYWLVGGISLGFCLLFIAPHLANFFPKVAALEWIRRIEYMILFFVAFSTIKSVKDIRDYIIALCVTVAGIIFYGLGQHYYLVLWHAFPQFFEKFPFCFPSFQTGNEEFAKGIPLCLPADARTTSTFGGHYDLAAYLVLILPILFTLILAAKRKILKIILGILFITGLMTLLFTASRTSFATYLIGISSTVLFMKKKKYLIPVWIVSIALLLIFSSSTAQRFLETIRFTSIITNSQGQVVGVAPSTLPSDLQKKISKNPVVVSDIVPSQNLPAGSSFITLPQAPVATSVAVVKNKIDPKEAERLKLQYGGLEISTVSGSFLIQKALVYDISFTTRFQAEWPRDFAAFLSSPVFGTGYSSLTLASDNDYLRALGETGAAGLVAFLAIFLILGIFMKDVLPEAKDKTTRLFVLGLAGGVVGLFANATLIDVFESSKVAEGLWILLGVGVGGLALFQAHTPDYRKKMQNFLTTHIMIGVELFVVMLVVFGGSLKNYFVADDFTWLRWVATSTFSDIAKYFINAQDFFYRPLDKACMLFMYTFFSFQPEGYHFMMLVVHFAVTIGVYILLLELFKKKVWAVAGSLLFLLLPTHAEDVYWIATISSQVAPLFMLYGLLLYNKGRKIGNVPFYVLSIIFAALGLASYEMGVVFPLLILALDVYMKRPIRKQWYIYVPFVGLDLLYILVRSLSHTVAAGGDYSYNLVHFIPNAVGNFIGYVMLFLFGEQSIVWVSSLRVATKMYAIPAALIIILVIFTIVLFFRKPLVRVLENAQVRLFIFGIVFAFFSLLTFIGLGNIAERYFYLASVGCIISFLVIVQALVTMGLKKSRQATIILAITAIVVLLLWWGFSLKKEQADWYHAGKITYNTLGYFKIEQDALPKGTTLYIVNRPIRVASAWVFPVGLPDGLWFVYRDGTQVVNYTSTLEEAQVMAGVTYPYIFIFDKNNQIHQVK